MSAPMSENIVMPRLSYLPSGSGDGYSFGGGVIVCFGKYAAVFGEGNSAHHAAELTVAAFALARIVLDDPRIPLDLKKMADKILINSPPPEDLPF
ncbi:MAG: hypothetical protein EBR82_41730 [Caulobacteraceae bacterium]|nr:hypothetical protein [Caulobacteraceae bacterium]